MADAARGFIRMRDIRARIPVAKSTIWAWVRQGKFPAPVKLSPKVTAWRAADVDLWETESARRAYVKGSDSNAS
jgi:prophage regulatory protein